MKTMFEKWQDEEVKNLSNFMTRLFQAYSLADGTNKARMNDCFPEYFVVKY